MSLLVVGLVVALVFLFIAALFAGVAAFPLVLLILVIAVRAVMWPRTRVGPPSSGT